jgi:hypothetical protein
MTAHYADFVVMTAHYADFVVMTAHYADYSYDLNSQNIVSWITFNIFISSNCYWCTYKVSRVSGHDYKVSILSGHDYKVNIVSGHD